MNNCSSMDDYRAIDIGRLSVDAEYIRKTGTDVSSLKRTIADVGLLQPILVNEVDGDYVVIDGVRRLQALKELGVPELIIGRDIIVDTHETEADTKFKQIIANIQREDINDIELGKAFIVLKERYAYQYKEIAEIICKTPHYVTVKVGLAKRLIPELQAAIIRDWESVKCIQNMSTEGPAQSPYVMNINVIEDVARLPAELQKAAYEAIKENEMDKKEALKYLRYIKHDAEILKIADDAKGLMKAYSNGPDSDIAIEKDLANHLKKLNRDIERLSVAIKAGVANQEEVVPVLESLIERLNVLYSEIKNEKRYSKAIV